MLPQPGVPVTTPTPSVNDPDRGGEESGSSTVGVVEAVSPSSVDVSILREAPHGTGLREGYFLRFPRINGFVVLPSERGNILAVVTWLGVDAEHLRFTQESDRLGLPLPRRRLRAVPLGVLRRRGSLLDSQNEALELDRGVLLFPTVGDPVRLPTRAEASAAVPGIRDDTFSIEIGRAPLAGDTPVHVDPNRLFGRHLAVLGNTGSGKSCSVAQLIRSSVQSSGADTKAFRAIILDMNGEYRHAFNGLGTSVPVRRFSVAPEAGEEQLRVPAWLWNYREWLSFTDASAKSQAPQLRRALHILRTTDLTNQHQAVVGLVVGQRIVRQYHAGAVAPMSNAESLSTLDNTIIACDAIVASSTDVSLQSAVGALSASLGGVLRGRRDNRPGYRWQFGCPQLNHNECTTLLPLFDTAIELLGVPEFMADSRAVDTPVQFDPMAMIDLLPLLAVSAGPDVAGWVAPMVDRLRIALSDQRLQAIAGWRDGESLADWLPTYLADESSSQITLIDLSLVPSHVLHLVVAVLVRTTLEALERHRRVSDLQAPTLLVVEEAHALIRRHIGQGDDDEAVPMARLCREAFERVAREGRKFGLSLVVSSQRPSELSETVLSQCNTFLVHRLVNDNDQRLVRRLLPDSLETLTQELPALPAQTGLLVGWAIEVPTMVRVRDLAEAHRPRSDDPDFASAWHDGVDGTTDWSAIAATWTDLGGTPIEEALASDATPSVDESTDGAPVADAPAEPGLDDEPPF